MRTLIRGHTNFFSAEAGKDLKKVESALANVTEIIFKKSNGCLTMFLPDLAEGAFRDDLRFFLGNLCADWVVVYKHFLNQKASEESLQVWLSSSKAHRESLAKFNAVLSANRPLFAAGSHGLF